MSDLIRRTTEFAMHLVSAYVQPGDTVIDATCGNGQDTLRLAQMGPARLFAFDVQEDAIQKSLELLRRHGFAPDAGASGPDGDSGQDAGNFGQDNRDSGPAITLACLGHEHMGEFFHDRAFASAIVFNLGYLPGGNKALTTRTKTTLAAVLQSLDLLKKGGLLCVTMYSGHPEGAEEKRALLAFAEGLDPKQYHVSYISFPNQRKAPPEILLISR